MPVNFGLLQPINPAQMAQEGFAQARAGRLGEERAVRTDDLRERQVSVQEGQLGLNQQRAEADQAVMQRKQEEARILQADIAAISAIENPTAKDINDFILKHPVVGKTFVENQNRLSTEAKEEDWKHNWELISSIKSGNLEVAEGILNNDIEAAENSGDDARAAGLKATLSNLKADPKSVLTPLILKQFSIDPKKAEVIFGKVGADKTSDIKNYNLAVEQGFKGSFNQWLTNIKKAGGSQVNVNLGDKLTPFQKTTDVAMANKLVEWRTGGSADSLKLLTQLGTSLDMLNSDKKITGFKEGNLPNTLLAIFNPDALEVKEQIQEVVQRNLKAVLGAQFTEKEGQRLIDRAFNPKLPQKTQARRVAALMTQMQLASDIKNEMMVYADEHGTLRGFTKAPLTMNDFIVAVEDISFERDALLAERERRRKLRGK